MFIALFFTVAALFSQSGFAYEIEGFENRQGWFVAEQFSPDDAIEIESAHVASRFVGGLWAVVAFSVPDTAYDKEVFFVTEPSTGRTFKPKFVDSVEKLHNEQANQIAWLGTEGGRAYFVMVAQTIYVSSGPYALYVKVGDRQYESHFRLER